MRRFQSQRVWAGVVITHAGTTVLITVTTTIVTMLATPNHELIASHPIDPNHNYWRKPRKTPRPMAGAIRTVGHRPRE